MNTNRQRVRRRIGTTLKAFANVVAGRVATVLLALSHRCDRVWISNVGGAIMHTIGPWLPEHRTGRANLRAAGGGPNVGTGTWSGHGSALRTAFYRRATTDPQLLEHAVHMRIIDASCTENGSDGGDGSPEGTDKLSTSVTNRACIAAGKAAKSAPQYWTHRDLKAS
jgi:hypothetical protein